MATATYHFDCKPQADSSTYRTMQSKYQSTCAACNQPIDNGDKIAYFPDKPQAVRGQSKPTGQSSAGESATVQQLVNEVAAIKNTLAFHKADIAKLQRIQFHQEVLLRPEVANNLPEEVRQQMAAELVQHVEELKGDVEKRQPTGSRKNEPTGLAALAAVVKGKVVAMPAAAVESFTEDAF